MDSFEVVVAGHICLDIIPELKGAVSFEPGRLVEAGPATLMTGGAVSNTGQSLYKLGVRNIRLVGKIGTGLFGRAIVEILERSGQGLGDGLVETDHSPTSYTIVVNLTGQDRMFLHAPGCNATFKSADVSDELLAQARLLHFGYPPLMARMFADDGEQLVDLFRRAKLAGCTTSLDMSLPDSEAPSGKADWRRILERTLPYVDLFLPSVEEATYMLERSVHDCLKGSRFTRLPESVYRRLAGEMIAMGAKVVVIKAGARGFYMKSSSALGDLGRGSPPDLAAWSNLELWAPAFQVNVHGTTGAGDATIAGLLMGLLAGFSPSDAAQAGVAAGACCCEQLDALSGVRPWLDTLQRIRLGWQSVDPELGASWAVSDGVYRPERG